MTTTASFSLDRSGDDEFCDVKIDGDDVAVPGSGGVFVFDSHLITAMKDVRSL